MRGPLNVQRGLQGAGIRILTPTISSPTLADQLRSLLKAYPQAKWHVYEPVNRDTVLEGAKLAFGQPIETRYDFSKANVILSLDADFLYAGFPGFTRYARDFAARFPKIKVDPNALYLKDGNFYTSAGLTAGIDLSLALIEEDFGSRVALAVARELVVYLKRPGGQEQYSEPLKFQISSSDAFAELVGWMTGHLHHDLSVEALAAKAYLGPRQFSRRFKNGFGTTPGAFVENLRLDEARQRLTMPNQNIESVAASVGFKSADVFRRAFERRYGLTPGSYRKRFNLRSK